MSLFSHFFTNDGPGPGIKREQVSKPAPVRFFTILFRKFGKLMQANLIFLLPFIPVVCLAAVLFFLPMEWTLRLPEQAGGGLLDLWGLYVVPLPLLALSPFCAGLTYVTRNFVQERPVFIWWNFWRAVRLNGKMFFLNGCLLYVAYALLSFSGIYYYRSYTVTQSWLCAIPLCFCVALGAILLFAQYYLPLLLVTFELRFWQAYRNACIFALSAFGRNLLISVVLACYFLFLFLAPGFGFTLVLALLLGVFLLASLPSYFVNFVAYPVLDRYLIRIRPLRK